MAKEPSIRVAVVGKVTVPGVYEVSGVRSLTEILALANGLNFTGDAKIQILRGSETILPTDTQVASSEATFSTQLKDGDVLYIIARKS